MLSQTQQSKYSTRKNHVITWEAVISYVVNITKLSCDNHYTSKKKQHVCHYPGCDKVYGKMSHLRAHLRWHRDERPFVCNWLLCGNLKAQLKFEVLLLCVTGYFMLFVAQNGTIWHGLVHSFAVAHHFVATHHPYINTCGIVYARNNIKQEDNKS